MRNWPCSTFTRGIGRLLRIRSRLYGPAAVRVEEVEAGEVGGDLDRAVGLGREMGVDLGGDAGAGEVAEDQGVAAQGLDGTRDQGGDRRAGSAAGEVFGAQAEGDAAGRAWVLAGGGKRERGAVGQDEAAAVERGGEEIHARGADEG